MYRNTDRIQDLFDNSRRGIKIARQADFQYRTGNLLDVVGCHKITAAEMGTCLRHTLPHDQPPGAQSQCDRRVLTRRLSKIDQILADILRQRNLGNVFLQFAQLTWTDDSWRFRPGRCRRTLRWRRCRTRPQNCSH